MSLLSLELDNNYIDSSIAELIRQRYEEGEFYHQIGKCFISVNPFHLLVRNPSAVNKDSILINKISIESNEKVSKYHPYKFAESIRALCVNDSISQNVIFRGCSGSGKTELLKSFIQYLICTDSSRKDVYQPLADSIHPLGSATNIFNIPSDVNRIGKVVRAGLLFYDNMSSIISSKNDHSSRNIKHIKLVYGSNGLLQGARMESLFTDLLRFSRSEGSDDSVQMLLLVAAGLGEKSNDYKISTTLKKIFLEGSLGINYYNGIDHLSQEFQHMENTVLESGALTVEEWDLCLKAFAACINLQCIAIVGTDCASISTGTKQYVKNAEELLGLQPDTLSPLILKREDNRLGKSSGSLVECRPVESNVVLEALSRLIFGRTFKFCLHECSIKSFVRNRDSISREDHSSTGTGGVNNISFLSGGLDNKAEIHFIDMPGWVTQFEAGTTATSSGLICQLNHMLQNYMEERFHAGYLTTLFNKEIDLYALENVKLDLSLPVSEPFIEFFEKPVTGVISLLEEACQAIKTDDRSFVDKVMVTHLKTKLVKAGGARAKSTIFIIRHSFGDVSYDCDGVVVQNKHCHLPSSVLSALGLCTIPFIANDITIVGVTRVPQNNVIASRFKASSTAANLLLTKSRDALQSLLNLLEQNSQTSYALCIGTAPTCRNSEKNSTLFNKEHVIAQSKYFAVPSLIALVQKGFPRILKYAKFYDRYRVVLPFLQEGLPIEINTTIQNIPELDRVAFLKQLCEDVMQLCFPYLISDTTLGYSLSEEDVPFYGTSSMFYRDKLATCLEQYRSNYLNKSYTAASKLQTHYRMYCNYKKFRNIKCGVLVLQSIARSFIAKRKFWNIRMVVNKVKATFRMFVLYRKFKAMQRSVQLIKSKYLGEMIVRIRFKRLQRSLGAIRGLIKGYALRKSALNTFLAVKRLQSLARRFLQRLFAKRFFILAIIKIQRLFRGMQTRIKFRYIIKVLAIRRDQRLANKVVKMLQSIWRRKLICKRFQEIYKATLKIQSWFRGKLENMRYNKMQRLVVWLQSVARRVGAQNLSASISAKIMVQQELESLSEALHNEVSSISSISNLQRIIGSGYTRNESSKFERILISFNLNFDLSFAYPNGWLKTLIDFCKYLREQEKKSIRKISVGSQHTVIVDDLNNVYTMGLGDLGQLGHNNRYSHSKPHKIDNLAQYLNSASLTSNVGTVGSPVASIKAASIGRSMNNNVEVKDVCCGKDHTLLLTVIGTVYSWGDNHKGQLGHSKYESSSIPRLVGMTSSSAMSAASNNKHKHQQIKYVKSICCGEYHSACLADPGTLYTWGNGHCIGRVSKDPSPANQVSLNKKSKNDIINDSCEPDILPLFSGTRHRVQHICSGENHMIARSGSELFSWGINHHGQLGDGTTTSHLQPVKLAIKPLTNELELVNSEIRSGGRHNVLLYKGELWSWGWNKYGQIGNDDTADVLTPILVTLNKNQSNQHYIRSINVGLRHTIVLTATQQLYGWGSLNFTTMKTGSYSKNTSFLSYIPKNLNYIIPFERMHHIKFFSGESQAVNKNSYLMWALDGSSSTSLSYLALDVSSVMTASATETTNSKHKLSPVNSPKSNASILVHTPENKVKANATVTYITPTFENNRKFSITKSISSVQKSKQISQKDFNTNFNKSNKPEDHSQDEILEKFRKIRLNKTMNIKNVENTSNEISNECKKSESSSLLISPSTSPLKISNNNNNNKSNHKLLDKSANKVITPMNPLKEVSKKDFALAELFSPKNLKNLKSKANQFEEKKIKLKSPDNRDTNQSAGLVIRESLAMLTGNINLSNMQQQLPKETKNNRNQLIPSSLGVGMPKTEKAFLSMYANKLTNSPSNPVQRLQQQQQNNDLQIQVDSNNNGKGTSVPSFMTPTLSYSSKLAARRVSLQDNLINSNNNNGGGGTTPINSRRLSSSSDDIRRKSFLSIASGNSSPNVTVQSLSASSPNMRANRAANVDPTEYLGLDLAIEKLQSVINKRLQS